MEEDTRHLPLAYAYMCMGIYPTLAHMNTYTPHIQRALSFGFGLFLLNLGSFEGSSHKHYVPTVLNPETFSLKGLKEEGWSSLVGPVSAEPRLDTMSTL